MYGPQPRKRKERLVTELPTAPFVQVKVFMISKLMKKVLNRESISYIIFGVLTTLVDWASYALFWSLGWDYKVSTALSWAAAVLFAFVTNKFWVFRSFTLKLSYLWKEFVSFGGVQSSHRSPDDVGDDPDGRWIPLERIFREINGFCHVSCVKLYYEQTVYLQEEKG